MRRGFRINAATLQLTHVSKGPVASAYQLDSTSILTVFSHHFIRRDGLDSLLTFFGSGDSDSCYSEVDVMSISWQRIRPGKTVNFNEAGSHKYELH